MADVGLHFPHHATVQKHLVWPEDSSAIQFAAVKQDVLKKTVDVIETAVDAYFVDVVKMGVSHFASQTGDFGQGCVRLKHGRCPFTLYPV